MLLNDQSFPARHTFIATAVRDIINILPQAIGVGRIGQGLQYRNYVTELEKLWPSESLLDAESEPDLDGSTAIPIRAYVKTDDLIQAHRSHPPQRERATHLLRSLVHRRQLVDTDVPVEKLASAMRLTHKWFQQWDHGSHEVRAPSEHDLQSEFAKFDQTLFVIVGQFFAVSAELDAILQATNP